MNEGNLSPLACPVIGKYAKLLCQNLRNSAVSQQISRKIMKGLHDTRVILSSKGAPKGLSTMAVGIGKTCQGIVFMT